MKKLFITLMSICFLFLCSCTSLMMEPVETTQTDSTPAYEGFESYQSDYAFDASPIQDVDEDASDIPEYTAQTYSIPYAEMPISKDDKVLFLCETGDFLFQRELETEIVAAFSENGIEVVAYSDVEIEAQPPFIDYLYAVALENDCRYVFIVGISEAYSYEYGGGISQINFDSNMADLDLTGIPLRITGAITCKENIFHSYIESLEPACKCMVEALVNEYMKYVIASEPVMVE